MVLVVEDEIVLLMDGTHPAHVRGEMKDCVCSSNSSFANTGIMEIAIYELVADWSFESVLASDVSDSDPAFVQIK
jgi:hypothetical protein